MKSHRYDPFVFNKKTVFMQRIADLVRTGHHHYVSGKIGIDSAAYLAEKFNKLYLVDRTQMQASRARAAGEATARLLFLLPKDDAREVKWILLKTDGTDYIPANTAEHWRFALEDKMRITLDGYELVRITKPGTSRPVWTWKYTRTQYDDIRTAIVAAIRHRDDAGLNALIHTLWRSPGFAGVRDQVKKVKQFIQTEWKRTRRSSEDFPEIPEHLGYVRRLEDKGERLSAILKKRDRLLDKTSLPS